jgi:predicted PurR-regulated permease PerM
MRSSDIRAIRRGVALLACLGVLALLERGRSFFVPLAFGACIAMCLDPVVVQLQRLRVPRTLGAALVLAAFTALLLVAVQSLQNDIDALLRELPNTALQFRDMLRRATLDRSSWWQRLNSVARNVGAVSGTSAVPLPRDGLSAYLIQGSLGLAGWLSEAAMVLLLAYFLLIASIPRAARIGMIDTSMLRAATVQVQRFVMLLTGTNVLLGLLTWALFAALGVSHAAVWGVAAAVLHVVPYAGPAAFAFAALFATAVQFHSFSRGLLVAGVAVAASTLIGVVLTSWLSGRASRMNKAAVFAGLLFWGWTWGLAGLLLGVPLMMILKVVADRSPGLRWLSLLLSEEPDDAKDTGPAHDTVLQSLRQGADGGPQSTRRDSVAIVNEENESW